jgi:hypothetical protein
MANVTPGYQWTSGEVVTPAKMNSAAAPTVTLADGEVTNAKLASGIDASKITTGTLPSDRIGAGAVTNERLSLAANAGEIKKALNADNAPPIFACRAWVNFDGTRNEADTGASTNNANVKVRASGNVTRVLKNTTGDYTVTFATPMPDFNYCAVMPTTDDNTQRCVVSLERGTSSANGARVIAVAGTSNTAVDLTRIEVAIFR